MITSRRIEPTSDLVDDTRIRVEFSSDLVHRFTYQSRDDKGEIVRRREKQEIWKKEKSIGGGTYGKVQRHRCLTGETPGELQAVKEIQKDSVDSNRIDFSKELEAIAKFSQKKFHGLFVEFYGWYENEESVFIVMEYIPRGDLNSYLTQPLPENEAREITFQVAEGLHELHENGFVHRDLKPQKENILVVKLQPQWWVKIGDFGFSKRVQENSDLKTGLGTPLYRAPEIQGIFPPGIEDTRANYSEKVDIWSLGVVVFYMLFHVYPFTYKDSSGLLRYVLGGSFPFPETPIVQSLSEESHKFLLNTVAPDARSRFSTQGVLKSSWLKQRGEPQPASVEETTISPDPDGKALFEKAHYKEAEAIFRRAAEKFTGLYGMKNEHTLTSLDWLGRCLYYLEAYSKSDAMFLQVVEGRTEILGAKHQDTLTSLEWQGRSLYYHLLYNESEHALRLAVDGRTEVLGAKHKDTINALDWLGQAFYWNEKYSESKAVLRRSLDGWVEILGLRHKHTLTVFEWFGRASYWNEDYADAEAALRQAVEGRKAVLGMEHAQTLCTFEWLGRALFYREDYADAEEVLRVAFKGHRALFGEQHHTTWHTLWWIGKSIR